MMTAMISMSMEKMEQRTGQQKQIRQEAGDVAPMFAQYIEGADEGERRAKQEPRSLHDDEYGQNRWALF
jgi:hypothetical protein